MRVVFHIFPPSEINTFELRDYRVVSVYTKNRRIAKGKTVGGSADDKGAFASLNVPSGETQDANRGNLVKISKELGGVKSYVLPDGVGERFSELCPVGLLPAAVLGIDIEEPKKELDNAASNPD